MADGIGDSLMQTLIDTVRDNTEKTVAAHNETIATRNSMTVTSMQLFQRIVDIERQMLAEARERPIRQKQLDGSIDNIKERLDSQDATLQGQDQKLDVLFAQQKRVIRAARWRMALMALIFAVCLFVAAWLVF